MQPALVAVGYFSIYLAYLFVHRESEWWHWVSLVGVPLAITIISPAASGDPPLRPLAALGINRARIGNGLIWAGPLGLALCGLQFWASRDAALMADLLASPRALRLVPVALGFSLVTAGFTEEFFFRGFLQGRLYRAFGRAWPAILITSLLFGAYHLPYAYMNPRWPSHGDWRAAFGAAFGQGVPGGLILGVVFHRSRGNLFAPVTVHALINLFPIVLSLARH